MDFNAKNQREMTIVSAITANVGNSTVQFLVVGVCVRAHPLPYPMKELQHTYNIHVYVCIYMYVCMYVCVHA